MVLAVIDKEVYTLEESGLVHKLNIEKHTLDNIGKIDELIINHDIDFYDDRIKVFGKERIISYETLQQVGDIIALNGMDIALEMVGFG